MRPNLAGLPDSRDCHVKQSPAERRGRIARLKQLPLEIQDIVIRYRTAQGSSDVELRVRIGEIHKQATILYASMESLITDSRTRRLIAEYPTRHAIDPLSLMEPLRQLIKQTGYATARLPKPRRGPHGLDALRQLLVDLGVRWSLENPETKKGIKSVEGVRQGPMLDFVWKVLRRSKVRVQSEDSLGKMLFDLRGIIAERAARAKKKRMVTRKDGKRTITSFE